MSRYELLVFAHVLAAAAGFGAALLSAVLIELASRAREVEWLVKFGEFDEALAKVLFIPSALVVLGAGERSYSTAPGASQTTAGFSLDSCSLPDSLRSASV